MLCDLHFNEEHNVLRNVCIVVHEYTQYLE